MSTLFERVSMSLLAIEISERIDSVVSSEATCREAYDAMENSTAKAAGYGFCLVKERNHIVGYFTMDSLPCEDEQDFEEHLDKPVLSYMESIVLEQIVPSSTPVFELLSLFSNYHWLFISTINQITHILTWRCLDKEEFRYCLFGLTMQIESYLSRLICNPFEKRQERFRLLSPNRLEEARKLQEKIKENDISYYDPILFTTFPDKITIALKDEEILKVMPFVTRGSAKRFLDKVRKLRNYVAHGRSIMPLMPRNSFVSFVSFVSEMNKLIHHLEERLANFA